MRTRLIGKKTLALATLVLGANVASAGIITLFSDDFNRGSGSALDGSTPTTVNSTYFPGGLTWQAHANNTTTAGAPMTGGQNMLLNYTPESGKTYLYTVVFKNVSGGTVVGFGDRTAVNIAQNNWWDAVVEPSTLVTFGLAGNVWGAKNGSWPSAGYTAGPPDANGFNTVEWLLDTTQPTWVADLTINGTSIGQVNATTGIDSWGVGRVVDDNTVQVKSVQLQLIPEPTSGLLLLSGAAGLGLLRRKLRG